MLAFDDPAARIVVNVAMSEPVGRCQSRRRLAGPLRSPPAPAGVRPARSLLALGVSSAPSAERLAGGFLRLGKVVPT
jgi:hypothetical protein